MPLALTLALCSGVIADSADAESAARETFLQYEIIAEYPHDVSAFTQGLAVVDGLLVESTGRYGHSAVVVRDLKTGAAVRRRLLDKSHFGEGLAFDGTHLLQLTWQSGLALMYDLQLNPLGSLRYAGEGWGLAHDGRHWLMSDGSERITRRTADFRPAGTIRVTDRGRAVRLLNELEYARGRLYANVWMTDRIAVIDPSSGRVTAWLDLGALRMRFAKPPGWDASAHVLNGIAFDPRSGNFYVTGKSWPVLYELRLPAPPGTGAAPP